MRVTIGHPSPDLFPVSSQKTIPIVMSNLRESHTEHVMPCQWPLRPHRWPVSPLCAIPSDGRLPAINPGRVPPLRPLQGAIPGHICVHTYGRRQAVDRSG